MICDKLARVSRFKICVYFLIYTIITVKSYFLSHLTSYINVKVWLEDSYKCDLLLFFCYEVRQIYFFVLHSKISWDGVKNLLILLAPLNLRLGLWGRRDVKRKTCILSSLLYSHKLSRNTQSVRMSVQRDHYLF